MKQINTPLSGCFVIEHRIFGDDRGFFVETYNERLMKELGLPTRWAQDNLSRSGPDILRGMHFQSPSPQGKLVRCTRGRVFDVVVDLRKRSATFGKSFSVELSESNKLSLWIPEGFAHGFLTLDEVNDFQYKCTEFYDPKSEHSLKWNDPGLGIQWPTVQPKLSDKDRTAKSLSEIIASNLCFD